MGKNVILRAIPLILAALLLASLWGCARDPHAGMVSVADGTGGEMWVPLHRELPVAAFKETDFVPAGEYIDYTGIVYEASRGIDVSEHQGVIDWNAVRADGVEFAVIRAGYRGYSEGSLNTDATCFANLEGAKAAGLRGGVYFFSQATDVAEAQAEADYLLALLNGVELELPVFFDWERIDPMEDSRTAETTGEVITACASAFCEKVKSAGYDAGIYFYRSLGYLEYDLSALKGLIFWAAAPGDYDDFYYEHTLWQYSYTGQVNGIEGSVDLNLMYRAAVGT